MVGGGQDHRGRRRTPQKAPAPPPEAAAHENSTWTSTFCAQHQPTFQQHIRAGDDGEGWALCAVGAAHQPICRNNLAHNGGEVPAMFGSSTRATPRTCNSHTTAHNTPHHPGSSQTQVRFRGICDLHGRTPRVSTPILARTDLTAHPTNSRAGPDGGQRHQPGKSWLSRAQRRAGHLIHEAPSRCFVAPQHARA
jgi:hypothetical protein